MEPSTSSERPAASAPSTSTMEATTSTMHSERPSSQGAPAAEAQEQPAAGSGRQGSTASQRLRRAARTSLPTPPPSPFEPYATIDFQTPLGPVLKKGNSVPDSLFRHWGVPKASSSGSASFGHSSISSDLASPTGTIIRHGGSSGKGVGPEAHGKAAVMAHVHAHAAYGSDAGQGKAGSGVFSRLLNCFR